MNLTIDPNRFVKMVKTYLREDMAWKGYILAQYNYGTNNTVVVQWMNGYRERLYIGFLNNTNYKYSD